RQSLVGQASCLSLIFLTAITLHAQTNASPQDITYSVASRDANTRVWAGTNYSQDASGAWVTNVHSYTELATGVCYTNESGQWLDSVEAISVMPDGSAQAVQGLHKAYFPADIYDGVLEVIASGGTNHLYSRPLGVSYDDGS